MNYIRNWIQRTLQISTTTYLEKSPTRTWTEGVTEQGAEEDIGTENRSSSKRLEKIPQWGALGLALPNNYYSGAEVKNDEMGQACREYGGEYMHTGS